MSPHTRRTIEEHDAARRVMYAARRDESLPKDYGRALLQLHDRSPFAASPDDVAALAAEIRDANFRIDTAQDGIHVYNRDGHHVAQDAFSLFSSLRLDGDAPHAFYLGAELMKAEIAFMLGKRYAQDEPLDWGCGADRPRRRRPIASTSRAPPSRRAERDDLNADDSRNHRHHHLGRRPGAYGAARAHRRR